jgi:hypothetical protein
MFDSSSNWLIAFCPISGLLTPSELLRGIGHVMRGARCTRSIVYMRVAPSTGYGEAWRPFDATSVANQANDPH